MKNRIFIIVLAVIALLVAGFLLLRLAERLQKKDNLRVGVILPLTGSSSYIGNSVKNGMEIAVDEFNSRETKPFELEIEYLDSSGSPSKVVTNWQSLMATSSPQTVIAVQEGVKGIIPLAESDERVLLATSVPDNGIAGVNPWTFRFFINAKTDSETIATYAISRLGKKTFGVIYVNDSMGISYRDSFKNAVGSQNGTVVSEQSFRPEDTEFRTQVLRLKEAKPEAIYIVGYGLSLSNIPLQLREQGVTSTLLAVGAISQPEIMAAAGESVEGCYYTTSDFFTFAPTTPELKSFVDAYKAKFGNVPVFFEVFGYDSLRIMIHAADDNGTEPKKIRDGLASVRNARFAVGTVTVGPDHDIDFPVVVKMIKDGNWASAVPSPN